MVLRTGKIDSVIPEGTVLLTREEALAHQRAIIRDWPREIDVISLRYASHIAAAATTASTFTIVNYFKNFLRLGNRPYFLLFTPNVIIPAGVSYYVTEKVLTTNTLLMKIDCPLCHLSKFTLAQLYVGVAFPSMFGYFSFATVAQIAKTYPLPYVNKYPREFWKVTFSILKQGKVKFQTAGLIQVLLVLFLPYLQNKQFEEIMYKLQQDEARQDLV